MPSCRWLQGVCILACASAWIPALTCSPTAHAQVRVHVRASSVLELRVQRAARGAVLEGALFDDTGRPLAGRRIQLLLPGVAARDTVWRVARTHTDGSFALRVDGVDEHGRALARFAGDADYEGSDRTAEFDLALAELELRFVSPRDGRIDLDAPEREVLLHAVSEAGGAQLPITLWDESERLLGSGTTDAEGVLRLAPEDAAVVPGTGVLLARSSGDATRAPTEATLHVLRYRRSALSLSARHDRGTGRVWLQGTLRDRNGGIPQRTVGLFDGERHVASLWTDANGAFRHAAAAPFAADPAQPMRLQARFESSEAALISSRSPVVALALEAPSAASRAWLLAPLAICAVLVLTWRRAERRSRAAAAPPPLPAAGIHAQLASRHGHATVRDVSGSVLDHERERPLPTARLSLHAADGRTFELSSDASGRFRSPPLDPGAWTLRASADGYHPLSQTLTMPHRGQWTNIRVRLQNLRGAALLAYEPVAVRALPAPELWKSWTPREVLRHARRNGSAGPALARLTDRVERAAYAPTAPTDREIAEIEREVEALLHDSAPPSDSLGGIPSSAPPPPPDPGRR